jgi:hypothetical protein
MLKHHDLCLRRSLEYRQKNRDKIREYHKQLRLDLKIKAYNKYGGCKCCWCGEDDILALSIDHINNGGNKHFDAGGYKIRGSRIYTWLKMNNYPNGFQILCLNCNYAKSHNNGVLPENRKNLHQKEN